MLESGSALRHTQQEIEWFKEIGVDLSEVRSEADLTRVLCEWIEVDRERVRHAVGHLMLNRPIEHRVSAS
jgi:hypothetical protein